MAKPGNLVSEAFWSKDASDEEQSVVVVPGLLMEGNVRSETKVKCCKIQEVRAKPTQNTDFIFVNPMKTRPVKLSMSNEVIKEKQGSKTASLKDLCPEDKRRIANLIKELARVSEEKEETKERLKAEQESFEKKIKELEDQNNLIVTEREALQQQYKKCQELLTVYQNYLSEQKEKLNQSLRDCNNGKLEVNAKKNSPQTAASNLNGSYLGIVPPSTLNAVNKSKQVLVCPSVAPHGAHYFPNNNVLNRVHPVDNLPHQNGCEMKTETSIHGNPVLVRHCNIKDLQVGTSSFTFDTTGDQLSQCGWLKGQTDNGNQFTDGHNRNFIPLMEHNVTSGMFCDAAVNGWTGMMTGDVLHEMKMPADQKQQLLCQKRELELEKETLQRLLAQQEALLLLKQQQLQESVLDYSRSKHNLLEAEDVTYGEVPTNKTRISLLNSAGSTERYLKSGDRLYNASLQKLEGNIKASTAAPWERLNGNKVESVDPGLNTFRGITSIPKKDAATSPVPVVKKYQPVNMATSPIWPESLSYEASLVHLVDTLSPVSSQKHNMHIKETYGTPRKSNLTLSGYHQRPVRIRTTCSSNSDEELEESRMLEDIFFI
ncbi:protein hinderin isoform X2 [Hypanus sabinus]|uniref:protein hinderin isoform X2 n=1 Tax=Hypanus sabinus TaxID=79690 RepID=UPI0028C49463|nr:protein hinderin isoform X2 [Hypanus sabinus]